MRAKKVLLLVAALNLAPMAAPAQIQTLDTTGGARAGEERPDGVVGVTPGRSVERGDAGAQRQGRSTGL